MKRILNILFSMPAMGVLLLIFAFSIGAATFIENDFGTEAAKAVVYNALWFDILLALLAVNLVANIINYKMYKPKKFSLFLFHAAFLVILLGAAITRFISFEGMMHLREGETKNTILSDKTYVTVSATDGQNRIETSKPVLLSLLSKGDFSFSGTVGNKKLELKSVAFIPNAREVIAESDTGSSYVTLVTSTGMGRHNIYLKENSEEPAGNYIISFGNNEDSTKVNIFKSEGSLFISAPDTIHTTSMTGAPSEQLLPLQPHAFQTKKLYTIGNLNIVLTDFYTHGVISYVPYDKNKAALMDVVTVEARSGNETQKINLRGGKGYLGEKKSFTLNGLQVELAYGAKEIVLPFSLKLNDFQLERYPGSMSPSSYASEVTLIDEKENVNMPYRIYMNHVLDYKGYRFFQSSYDQDELGSVLSVNHDYWGTFFTYLGYLLLALGMAWALFAKNTRFAALKRMMTKRGNAVALIVLFFLLSSSGVYAQHGRFSVDSVPQIDKKEAKAFGELMVQSRDGRLKPVNTLASEVLRKVSRKNSFHGLNPDQVMLGMLAYPLYWQQVPMIKISNKEVAKIIGIKGKYASYMDFIDLSKGSYKLGDYVTAAYNKKPSMRGMFDKELMKVDERMNICYMIYTGDLLNIIPDPRDPKAKWFNPNARPTGLPYEDSLMVVSIVPHYLNAVKEGNKKLASQLLEGLKAYQKKFGSAIMPPERKIKAELLYNKLLVFDRLSMAYGLVGFIMIILLFMQMFKERKAVHYVVRFFFYLVVAGFVIQTAGLALRWYISGHAPWSDGYESMIYIGWVIMLAGLLFSRRSMMTVAATTILTSILLMVAHLSWMDPEITNLVPVLKSYWLTIHVSVITASYGFLALGMLLGFINLLLMILTGNKNRSVMEQRIRDLTAINERTLIIGLYMLTIGTFLGGVWANESWGRYWGWDPKETWALVSVLVYSFILHMRFIPGLKSRFAFNFASVIGYFSILMTYFGVNYYLSGLHSYAKGDPVPIPSFVYYTVAIIILTAVAAYNREKRLSGPSGS